MTRKRRLPKLTPRDRRIRFLRRNAWFALPLALFAAALSDGRWNGVWTRALLFSFPLCFCWQEAFLWRETANETADARRILLLARFWRHGFFTLIPAASVPLTALFPARDGFVLALGGGVLAYGAWTVAIALAECQYFACGMQDIAHRPMRPYARPTPRDRREGVRLGLLFIAMGAAVLCLSPNSLQ